MEIFQNLWTVLTSENAQLTNILAMTFAFVDAIFVCLFFTLLLNISSTRKQKVIFVISLSLSGILCNTFIIPPFNSILFILFCLLLIILIFKINILKAIMAELLPNAIFVLIGIVVHNMYILLCNIPTSYIATIPIHKLNSSLLLYIFVYFVFKVIKYFKFNISLLDDLKQKINSTLIFNFALGIIAIGIQSYIFTIYSDIIPFYLTLLNVGILLFYFSFSLYSLIRTNNLERTKRDLEQSKQYNKTLTILHDNIRCFKHDFNNIVTTIGGYVQTGDLEGLKKYYNELLGDCQKVNNLSALNPAVINDPAVYSLLTNKYHLADEKGITINLEIFLDLTGLNMKMYEFTRILRHFNG